VRRVDHRRAHDDRVAADVAEREREQRQEQVVRDVDDVRDPRHPAGGVATGGEPVQPAREQQQQQHAQPPLGHRVEDQRSVLRRRVEPAAAVPPAADADQDAEVRREERAEPDQQDGRPHADPDHVLDVLAGTQGVTEVPAQGLAQVDPVLFEHRPVQTEVVLQPGDVLIGQPLAPREHGDGIAGQDPEQVEVERQDEQEGHGGLQRLAQQVPP
jgi:hypothetical protein